MSDIDPKTLYEFAANPMRLAEEIKRFCARHDIAVSAFGRHAVQSSSFVSRLSTTGSLTPKVVERCVAFMTEVEGSAATEGPAS